MNRFCSIFSQLLSLFSREDFQRAVQQTGAERHCRGFRCWDQFVAMVFCQLGRAHSLREIYGGLASSEGRLSHLGMEEAPSRSTLSYANAHRPWQLYEKIFYQILGRCQQLGGHGRKKFRFKNKLLSLDSTLIELCVSVFDWAKYTQTKGAVKLHLLLDHDGHLPVFAHITDGKDYELPTARGLSFEPGTIVVFDRGYIDLTWFNKLNQNGVFFVTRMRRRMVWRLLEEKRFQTGAVVSDQRVELRPRKLCRPQNYPQPLRRIEYIDPQTGNALVFLTNQMHLAAATIAEIYKQRWQIELFFKALKQNLKIKTFVGTSANALRIQIWTALIAILLVRYLQLRSKFNWSLSNLVALLRMNLFAYRDLFPWLDDPYHDQQRSAQLVQPTFAFG